MNKIDLKPIVYQLLTQVKEIKKVATDYPSNWTSFPSAIYRTSSQPKEIDSQKKELQTTWMITIELYGNTSLTGLTSLVIEKFNSIGFTGTSKDANTADMHRVIIELTGVVDNVTKYVYKK